MTEAEWDQVATLMGELWPTLAERMTEEQAAAWRDELKPHRLDAVTRALRAWYRKEAQWPVLATISRQSCERRVYGTYRPAKPWTDEDRRAYREGLAKWPKKGRA